ncbi:MAG: glutaredoxin family protein [Dehalococcoidia bacterium]
MTARPVVSLYTRAGCHLCDAARLLLDELAPRLGFTVEAFDIDTNAALLIRYDTIVPVVACAGVEVARAPIHEAALRRTLEARLRQSPSLGTTAVPPP